MKTRAMRKQAASSGDLSTAGSYNNAGDSLDERSYNQANELTQRILKNGTGSTVLATLPFSYDDAGNIRQGTCGTSEGLRYTHDAWGRLVKIEMICHNMPP